MDDTVTCRTLHVVLADRRYAPGETLELCAADAAALEAAGAVERVEEPPLPTADASRDPAPSTAAPRVVLADRRYAPGETVVLGVDAAAPRPAQDEGPESTRHDDLPPLTTLKGVGPKTAARLRVLGLETIAALARLDDAGLARAAAGIDVVGDATAQDRKSVV